MIFDIENYQTLKVPLRDGQNMRPITIRRHDEKLWLNIGFSKSLREELKNNLDGMKWHGFEDPPIKLWSCKYSEHNLFRLSYMAMMNPYSRYDVTPIKATSTRPLREHQFDLKSYWLTYGSVIWAAEMGLGKSLAAIDTIEEIAQTHNLNFPNSVIWVSTKSALTSVRLECELWRCRIPITFMTYEGLKKYVETISKGTKAPLIIIGDESHKLKNGTTQRTVSFAHVTRAMRQEYGDNCYVLLMTGTPAPKSPIDWYSQCEIVCPGFLKEGNHYIFKNRLAIIVQRENSTTGGAFPELVAWRDNSSMCNVCGKTSEDYNHDLVNIDRHEFVPCINEVELLYKRMKGLVVVKTKAECLDLPAKQYKRIYCKPKESTLRAMKMIAKTQPSAIKVLTLLRELSDGFQYTIEENGKKPCELCKGSCKTVVLEYSGPVKTYDFIRGLIRDFKETDNCDLAYVTGRLEQELLDCESIDDVIIDPVYFPQLFSESLVECPNCSGTGEVPNMIQSYKETQTSKDAALIDIIEDHDDVGRLVIYAGFTASIDRCCSIVVDQQWHYIRLDGRGWSSSLVSSDGSRLKDRDLVKMFQDRKADNKIVFIGNPGSAGTGLTLTASPTIVYYSNDFMGDSRLQSEDRIHRIGMDENRGAMIIDLIHLPSDEYVLENLLKKRRLQDMSLGQIVEILDKELVRTDYE